MKTAVNLLIILSFIFLLVSKSSFALNNYYFKTIAIDNAGQLLPDTTLTVRITIISATGNALYQETHSSVRTNQFGTFIVKIGTGTKISGDCVGITSTAGKRIKVETNAGSGYVLSVTTLLTDITHNLFNELSDFAWMVNGNEGTSALSNFLGTTDNEELHIEVHNEDTLTNSLILDSSQTIYRDGYTNGGTLPSGDARGTTSVDLQIYRDSSKQVASGKYSVIAGGACNKSGDWATITGGWQNYANGYVSFIAGGAWNSILGRYSVIVGGDSNTISNTGEWSFIAGGWHNTINSSYSVIGGGHHNTATGECSVVLGGKNTLASNYGEVSYSSGSFAAQGDAQTSLFVVRNETTTNASTVLYLDGIIEGMTIPVNTTWAYRIIVVARSGNGAGNSAAWEITGLIDRTFLGTPNVTTVQNTPGWTNPSVILTGNNMQVQVQGASGTTIRWVARVEITEVGL